MIKKFVYLFIIKIITTVFSLEGCRFQNPDGSGIAFALNSDGNFEIYVMDSD